MEGECEGVRDKVGSRDDRSFENMCRKTKLDKNRNFFHLNSIRPVDVWHTIGSVRDKVGYRDDRSYENMCRQTKLYKSRDFFSFKGIHNSV